MVIPLNFYYSTCSMDHTESIHLACSMGNFEHFSKFKMAAVIDMIFSIFLFQMILCINGIFSILLFIKPSLWIILGQFSLVK